MEPNMLEHPADAGDTVAAWLQEAEANSGDDSRHEPQPSKRADVRFAWNTAMELMDGEHVHYVHCRDISRSGMGILCRTPFEPGDRVYLRRDERESWVPCRVAHCTATVGTYRMGMELHFDF